MIRGSIERARGIFQGILMRLEKATALFGSIRAWLFSHAGREKIIT